MKKFGVMLDCSRNAVLNVETVKKHIDNLNKMGFNMLMLYTEDTYEVNNEKMFGYLRGKYSKEELKEIDKYAKSKNVELIPCVQTLAHLNQIFRWDEYGVINDVNDILLVDDERTYKLIDNIFNTLSECFTSRNVNIGMDEAHMLGLGRYLTLHGYHHRMELLLRHLNKVNEIAKKYGFTIMMWSDMFFSIATNGGYYDYDRFTLTDDVKKLVPQGIKLIYWDYYHQDKNVYDSMLSCHEQFDNDICFAGGIWTWTGFAPQNRFTINATKAAMSSVKEHKDIDTIIMTHWKDNGGECSFFAALPSLFYAKEIYNNITDEKQIKKNFYDTFNIKFDHFMNFDLLNVIDDKDNYGLTNLCKYMLYNDPFLGFNDYTVMGNEVKFIRKNAKKILNTKGKMQEYDYLCDYYASLAKLLSYKYDLGVNTRKAYKDNNKEELRKVIRKYTYTIKYLKEFINYFRIAWFKENKPHGFDVQEIRLGGLLLRLESCKARLVDFTNGTINKIEELEEEIIPLGKKQPKEANVYQTMSTVNVI